MDSIFSEKDNRCNPSGKFWMVPEKYKHKHIKGKKLLKAYLYTPISIYELEKHKFLLTEKHLYCLNSEDEPYLMSCISWKQVEPFVEENADQRRFGFRLGSGSVFQDFYTKTAKMLERCLKALASVCIFKDIEYDFNMMEEIGNGSFGSVYKAFEVHQKKNYAVKTVCKEVLLKETSSLKNFTKEIEILRKINHPNVTKLHKVYESEDSVHLILDYAPQGDLFQRLKEAGEFSERESIEFIKTLLTTLRYLHSKGIAHRDIKPENILMCSTNNYDIKVSDMGLACKKAENDKSLKCGSPGYTAPEILKGRKYNYKVDIFSVGILLYVVLSGCTPFYGDTVQELVEQNRACKLEFPKCIWGNVSELAKDFIRFLAEPDPQKRPTASVALKHPWLLGGHPNVLKKSYRSKSTPKISYNRPKK